MKFFVIFAAVICMIGATVDELYNQAWAVHGNLAPRQNQVDTAVSDLRQQLTTVLDVRTTEALQEIENNTRQVIELERPFRVMLTSLPVNPCTANLLSQLDEKTAMTGFSSAICVNRYDTSSQDAVEQAEGFIAQYEGLFIRLQKAVIRGFRSPRNHITNHAAIISNFTTEYNSRIAEWDAMRPQAEDFEYNIGQQLAATHVSLDECMSEIRGDVSTRYQDVIAQIPICEEFNAN